MLVRIQVSNRDSRRLQLADLSRNFGFDLIWSQPPEQSKRGKLADPFAKAWTPARPAAGIEQADDRSFPEQGSAIHQHDMTAHSESRPGLGQ
jgi:hypothetical protein